MAACLNLRRSLETALSCGTDAWTPASLPPQAAPARERAVPPALVAWELLS